MRPVARFAVMIAVLAGSSHAASADACDKSPDLMRIPGSTDAEHDARYIAFERARDVIFALELEKSAIESSWSVYLGKVDAVESGLTIGGNRTFRVKPVWQVRGMMPTQTAVLEQKPGTTSCSIPGDIWDAKPGDLVVVFENPGSKSGWRADQVRSGELVDAIDTYALSLEKKAR